MPKLKPRMTLDNVKFYGVEDLNIVCPICRKTDWCVISEHGFHAICGRTYSIRKIGQSGYLHPCNIDMNNIEPSSGNVKVSINWRGLQDLYQNYYQNLNDVPQFILDLENEFGIQNLEDFNVGYDGEALTIPAYGNGQIVGMYRRFPDGSKRMANGSSLGLVDDLTPNPKGLIICEGFTDTIAVHKHAYPLYRCIGRASCNTGKEYIGLLMNQINPDNVIIIADNDKPGLDGARELFEFLKHCPKEFNLRVYRPIHGCKDIRELIQLHGNQAFMNLLLINERK